ncbi:hypothetical protein ACQ27_gp091 [Klebsiella phage K64-1]|nr:hypothetical protein ACQ27_gp091 [Klebsiella phage K64-1]
MGYFVNLLEFHNYQDRYLVLQYYYKF